MDFDSDSPPKISPGIAGAHKLQLATFHTEPAALVELRKEFKDLGLHTQENELTYAIRRRELSLRKEEPGGPYIHKWPERIFNILLFDWTCQYGMSPGRPILLVAAFAVLFAIVYVLAQCFSRRRHLGRMG
jgi:hypothetical protein